MVSGSLRIVEGTLLLQGRVIVPRVARDSVLSLVHAGGHFGQKRTLQNLKRSYFWLGMARDTRVFCRNCLVCQQAKCSNRAKAPLQEFKMEGIGPGDLVAMDIATLPWSDDKFRYFLCIVDAFTRYVELIPMHDQSAATLVREFQRGWIFRGHGVPKGLLTDQAHNIDGVEIRAFCKKLGIEKLHSSPYHPQGDGLVERAIGLAKQVARCLTLERKLGKESWPEVLPEVAFYCNNVENSSTKFYAQLLMFGRQPTSPIDATIAESQLERTPSVPEHVKSLQKLSAEIRALARQNDQQTRNERNNYHNKGTVVPRIERGDSILEKNETRKDALDPKFKGPYKVLDVRDTRVKIQKGRKRRWIHINRCKQFTGGNNECETTSSTYPIAASRPPLQATAPSAAGVSDEKEQDHDRELTSTQDVPLPPGAHEEGPQPEAGNREIITQGEKGETERRYPIRNRKPREYPDYILNVDREHTAF